MPVLFSLLLVSPTFLPRACQAAQVGVRKNRLDEDSTLFDFRFSRSYRLMHFIACRIQSHQRSSNRHPRR